MTPDAPFNVAILDVDAYIKMFNVERITTLSINEPSSNSFAEGGLFSETIFGQRGSAERLTTFGYIELNTRILQPLIYKNVVKLAGLYEEIMNGAAYARFNEEHKRFDRVGTPDKVPDAGTGYTFFMSRFDDLIFEKNDSQQRSDRIDILTKYKDILFCRRFLVMPAGLRDLEEEQGNLTTDDINKMYQTLLSYSFAIPSTAQSAIYDSIRMNLQRKAVEIYNYIENILTGKRGFIQGSWGHRRVALGTRNVITAADYAAMTPDTPQVLQPDETKIGLFQTMKALQPIVVYHVRKTFFDTIFGQDSNTVPLIDPDTLDLVYREVDNKELNKFDSTAAVETWISRFRNVDIRNNPITVRDTTGKNYYLLMVYDTGDEISLFRGLKDFKHVSGRDVDEKKIRPLTWTELFYMTTYNAALGKHVFITRYPVIQDESCYPSKIHLCSTIPSRIVKLKNDILGVDVMTYPEYPILGQIFLESIQVSTSRLAGLGGDYDGDTVSANAILSEEANAEIAEFLNTPQSLFNSQKQLLVGANDDLIAYSLISLSYE